MVINILTLMLYFIILIYEDLNSDLLLSSICTSLHEQVQYTQNPVQAVFLIQVWLLVTIKFGITAIK